MFVKAFLSSYILSLFFYLCFAFFFCRFVSSYLYIYPFPHLRVVVLWIR